MSRAIDANALMLEFAHVPERDCDNFPTTIDIAYIKRMIRNAPTIGTVRRGKWIYDAWCKFKCSECGGKSNSEPVNGKESFCPSCGAQMDGETP